MKKRTILLLTLFVILVAGSVSVYAAKEEFNIDIMEKVGQLFNSYRDQTDESIYARGKSGGVITTKDIEQATDRQDELKYADCVFRIERGKIDLYNVSEEKNNP